MPTVSDILDSLDYGPAPEGTVEVRGWLAARGRFGHFIGGAFTAPVGLFDTLNPATGEVLAQVTQGTPADVAAAVAAARVAQPGWAALPGHERAEWLYALARQVQKRERFLAVLEVLDTGKPIREARDIDLPLVVRHFYHHAGWAEVLADQFPGAAPLGVCGQIIPWNFPLLMLAWKLAPALAAGNTVVLKPAEWTPLTALAFAEICAEIGLPAGVVNIVTGDGATGAALVAAEVDKIAFTGSSEVGREIRRATAGTAKRLTLELGGKSPFIVFADADLEAAIEGVVDGIWFNQGQVCCAGSRLLVAEAVADAFTERLRARMARLRVGDPLDKGTDIGAIIHPDHLARIGALVAEGQAAGAELVQAPAQLPARGCYCAPGFFTGAAPANPVSQREIFGPIATLTTFRTPDEAVQLANASCYGLAASIWSENLALALDIAARVKAGVVWVNSVNVFDAGAPFGGMRDSGFGREGGRAGMLEYLAWPAPAAVAEPEPAALVAAPDPTHPGAAGGIDRTAKLYIGGAQKRPDSGQSYAVRAGDRLLGLAPWGSRKDIRNAVEAAQKASGWAAMAGHARAQVLYFIAENLSARAAEFAARLAEAGQPDAQAEVQATIRRAFYYAALADKHDGRIPATRARHLTLVQPEPHGVIGIACPNAAPLLGLASLILPAIAMGNRVVAIPAQDMPFAATDLAQVFDCSDLPGGVVNLVTGPRDDLVAVMACHDDVNALWVCGTKAGAARAQADSAGNLKPVWVMTNRDWQGASGQGQAFLDHAVRLKTIWLPFGA